MVARYGSEAQFEVVQPRQAARTWEVQELGNHPGLKRIVWGTKTRWGRMTAVHELSVLGLGTRQALTLELTGVLGVAGLPLRPILMHALKEMNRWFRTAINERVAARAARPEDFRW